VDALSEAGTYTVFAPDNVAFEKLGGALTKLLDPLWRPQLRDVLLYHVLGEEVRSADVFDGLVATALNGEDITVDTDPIRVNEEALVLIDEGLYDIRADNGVAHGVDAVLLPAAATAAGLAEDLSDAGPFTLFAPTDAAFEKLPRGALDDLLRDRDALADVLAYHAMAANAPASELPRGKVETLNGDDVRVRTSRDGVRVNKARVVRADVVASNGIIHVVDAVLLPPDSMPERPNRWSKSSKSKNEQANKDSKRWDKSGKVLIHGYEKASESAKSHRGKYDSHKPSKSAKGKSEGRRRHYQKVHRQGIFHV